MRKFTRGLPFFFILFLFSKNTNAQLLWEISGNELTESSYLFGTIHIPDKRAYEFNDSVFAKIEACEAFAMEILMTEENQKLMEKAIELKDGQTFKSFYSKEDYEFLTSAFKEKIETNIENFESMHPAAVEIGLMYLQINNDMETSVDEYLYDFALSKNKKTFSVEPIQTQINLFTNSPEKGLVKYMKNWETYNGVFEEMILIYQKEELDKVLAMIQDETYGHNLDEMIWKRNVTMTDSIDVIIQRQSTFVAIGTGHLPGEGGVIDLLEKKGYQLKPIIASKTQAPKIEKPIDFFQWKSIENKEGAFSVKMPIEPEFQKVEQPTEVGNIDMHLFIVEEPNDENAYVMSYSDYPIESVNSELFSSQDLEAFYTRCIDGGTRGAKGELIKVDDVVWGGHRAKAADISIKEVGEIRYLVLLLKNRLFIGQVITATSLENNPELDYFVQSFKVTHDNWTTPSTSLPIGAWKLFESKEGKFSAMMFGKPAKSFEKVETEGGDVHLTFETSEARDEAGNEIANSVMYIDYPPTMVNADSMSIDSLSDFYLNTLTRSLQNQKAEILSKEAVTLDGKPSILFKGVTGEEGGKIFINSTLLLVKNRMYLLQYVTGSNQPHKAEVDKFLNSFKLIKPK